MKYFFCCKGSMAALLLSLFPALSMAAPKFSEFPFQFPAATESVIAADLNGDSHRELISVLGETIRIYTATEAGFDFESGYVEIPLESNAVAWDISRGLTNADNYAIVTLTNGSSLQAWQLQGNTLSAPILIADNLPGFIGRGITRTRFLRDINGDDLEDLVIPGAGVLYIYINTDAGFQSPLTIQSETRTRTQLDLDRLNVSSGQSVTIPFLELRDVNNDGSADLISRTEARLDVFLAATAADAYFPRVPSYSVDIAAIEARLGEFDVDNVDFSNLTGVLALTHEEILDDVDNDGIEDLLIREGGKVSLFSGNATGMNLETPRQVLRSGGNVLSTFLYDENEDGLNDLWLWRVEPISVGDLFVWLALSGSIAIEAFVYPNDGDRFARRPNRRISVELRFPSVMRLANYYESISTQADQLDSDSVPPHSIARLDSENDRQDLLVLLGDQLRVFMNSIEVEAEEEAFLGSLGYSRERDDYRINIRDVIDNIQIGSSPQLRQVEDQQADQIIELDVPVNRGDIAALPLNADEVDDIFVFTDYDTSQIRGLLLLSQ